jgi:hypothetical protein
LFDCAAALRINPSNIKAWYRSALACLALDNVTEAKDATERGLEIDPQNVQLGNLLGKITARKQVLDKKQRERHERETRAAAEKEAVKMALKTRKIRYRETSNPPEMEDAVVKLESALDPSSTLSIPVLLLYPVHAQSDFIKVFQENETLVDHLSYVFPVPWDGQNEYTPSSVDCYIETASGGLIKAGKKLPLLQILSSGKVELVDGLLKIQVIPHAKATEWIEEYKRRKPA